MATLRNNQKLAAVSRETQEEHPRNGQSRNTSVPRNNEEYIMQVSEEIEGRVTKKLSQEFIKTESGILGALSKLDNFLLNPQLRTLSGTAPGTSRNTDVENQEPTGDRSRMEWSSLSVSLVIQLTRTPKRPLTITYTRNLCCGFPLIISRVCIYLFGNNFHVQLVSPAKTNSP